ncbi:MAG: EF-P lysine aminoacylase GenX [Pseudomonadales bacterium]|jgi:lysyl-tRNA synthetase class 2|nr:EF-P lysine aminoacylase GenX [Pseudomonadales bacterium]
MPNQKIKNWQKLKSNPKLLEKFLMREKVVQGLRAWFVQENFHEVETPLLLPIPTTEPYYDVFGTDLKIFGEEVRRAYLAPSPEFQMKKLLAAGLKNIYQIDKCFRNNEGKSKIHQTEFTMLEYYRAQTTYEKLMIDMEEMFLFVLRHINQDETSTILKYQSHSFDLAQPFERLTVAQAFKKYANIDEEILLSEEKLKLAAQKKGYHVDENTIWEEVFNQILLNEIEVYLGAERPTILYEYPKSQAALARLTPGKPDCADRFELWIAGLEIGNAYGELIDAKEQKQRCLEEIKTCKKLGKTYVEDFDHDFIEALENITDDCSGIAMGVDRMIMLFADVDNIDEVTFFPTSELF